MIVSLRVLAAARSPATRCSFVSFPLVLHFFSATACTTDRFFEVFFDLLLNHINAAGVVQLVQWLGHGLDFSVLRIVQTGPGGQPIFLFSGCWGSYPGVKWPGRDINHSSASGAEHEAVCGIMAHNEPVEPPDDR